MVKKLLLKVITFWALILTPAIGWGQCPTSVSISANPGTTICAGTEVTFTANTSDGSNLQYQWQVNGTDLTGENKSTFASSELTNGQKVRVVITSGTEGENCSKTSSEITMTVNTLRTPTVSVSANKTSFCSGETITFSASNTHGGNSPQYEWFVNNSTTVSKTGQSVTFSSSDFNEGQNTVKVRLTSSHDCVTSETAEITSSPFTLKPDASIAATTLTEIESCINSTIPSIKFDIGGGGTGATVTGLPPGVTGSYSNGVYTISGSPTSAGSFDYTVNTTGTCEQTSATGKITVNPDATLSLTSNNNNQTVCAAGGVEGAEITPITYTVGNTGTGASVTGLPSGITGIYNNNVFTISGSSAQTGTHNFTVTANGTCGNSSSLTGSITITENLQPSVTITSSDADNEICAGTEVTFTATPTNGGSSPTYQWQVDGISAGSGTNTFTTSSLTDGQTVTVVMTSNETCRTENTATSDEISIKVNPNLNPSVSIEASDSDFCAGDEVTYTAIPVHGGDSPTFQWKIGSTVVGSGETFASSTLTNGQSITVTLTSSETCVTSATAVSDPVVTSVNENLYPSVSISSNDDNNIICAGGSISFTATPVNEGISPQYQWQINGSASGNITNSNSFNASNLSDGDKISVVLISSEECLAENNVVSNEIEVQVDNSISGETPTWDNTNTSHNPTAICPVVSGLIYSVNPIDGASSYDWTFPTGWTITDGQGTSQVTVSAGTNAAAGKVTVRGRNECNTSAIAELDVTTGTVVLVDAGPDQTVCPETSTVNLAGVIGGVITKHQDWDWLASVNGGEFTANGFSNGGNSLDGTYTIPTSVRNGGTVTIRIKSIDPAGPCGIKTDDMIITIESAASITDATNKNQTVCIDSEIEDISFTVGGAGQGATTTGLPAGVTGSFENGIYTLSGIPTEAGTFNYIVSTTGDCTNATRSGTLTVNPRPTFTQPEEIFVCAGSQTSTINFEGSSVAGTTYQWTNDNTSIGLAASGTGNIDSFNAVNDTNEPIKANITVTPVANSCEGTPQEFQITIYPTATFTKPEGLTVCNGENLEEIIFVGSSVSGTTYKWSNSNPSIGLAAEGTGNISSFSAVNTTNAPIEATVTVTPVANGCDGTPEEFTIMVNPTPALTAPESIVVCNGEVLSQINFSEGTVTGTTYNWTNDNPSIGLAASGTGSLPSFTAVNNGNEQLNATITVIPVANGCEGEPLTFDITVNPTTTVNTLENLIVCNGENLSELVFSSTVGGTSFSWTNSLPAIGLAESGTGSLPAFSAQNTTDQPVTATIIVTPTANDCEGTPFEFTITVNPSATVIAGPDQTICSNGVATMAATLGGGASEGVWTTSGSGTFSNNSINAEYTPSDSDALNGSVILTYTSNDPDGPCGTSSDTIELFINDEVLITTQPENIGICSTEPSELTVIASGDNLSYEWKRTDGANIIGSNGIYSSTLSFNNTTSTHSGEYYVIVRGEDTCNDVESERVTINVDENIVIEEPVTEVPICGDGFSEVTMKFIAHANGAPLTFTWYKDNVEIDADSDTNITITTGPPDAEGRYEGTLHLANITTAYNGDYYVEITGPEEFTCSTAVTNPFQLRLNEMPALPVVEDLVVCQNETPGAFTVMTGTNLKWYLNEEDTEFIVNEAGQPTAPVPSTEVPGDYFYWVTQQPEACESEKVQVKVTVKEKPAVPALTSEEALVEYCLGETAVPLTATGTEGATLNWYDSEDGEALASAPTPNTAEVGEKTYWVSQTPNDGFGCESDRAEITVTVFALPEVTITFDDSFDLSEDGNPIICSGSSIELTGNGAVSYEWKTKEEESVTGNLTAVLSPEVTTTYVVTGTNENGCQETAEITIEVDSPTVPGILTGPESVCATSPNGTITLSGYTGEIQRWEKSEDGGGTWTEITVASEIYEFSNLTTTTSFRAVVKSGVCEELPSNQINVNIDPIPVGGELNFAGVGRVFMICEGADPGYAVDLVLTGKTGEVTAWEYRSSSSTSWTTIDGVTETTLSANLIESLNISETTVFQAVINSGACTQNAYSKTAILSVIPTDIAPSPVTVDPGVVCFGSDVTLSSETGYGNGETFQDQGAFDNASITNHGWRVRRNGSTTDIGFDTDANNAQPDRWKRATPHPFTTANLTPNYSTSEKTWGTGIDDGNKGFAIVSSDNSATMETAVFSIGSMDQAILTFDQAYNLTPGASIKVEISTDGGNSYNTVLYSKAPTDADLGITSGNIADFGVGTKETRPENKIEVDLGNYLGRSNLRIRFSYVGTRIGDVWAIDNIKIPQGPQGVVMEWNDYTDPENPVFIGNNNSEQYTPTLVGWNNFEVKTKLVFDSQGNACEIAENSQTVKVFVFDQYTTEITSVVGSCGNYQASLTAVVSGAKSGVITEYPTLDGYMGRWVIEGTGDYELTDSDPNDDIEPINNPNVVIKAEELETFNVSWELYPTIVDDNNNLIENPGCIPDPEPIELAFQACIALDFDGVDDRVLIEDSYAGVTSIEAWIRPEREGGTIISGPNFKITTPSSVIPNSRWYHIAVSNGKLYIDGIENSSIELGSGSGSQTVIGAEIIDGEATNFFSGWIEEVRLWKKSLTVEQIRFMMNQRLVPDGAQMGEQIPMDVPGGLTYADLAGYYRLISADPEPLDVSPVVYLAEDMPANGVTPDRAETKAPGRLINMETNQENTAPLPYYSGNDGVWGTDATWLRPEVWDPPHTGPIEWNIVRTSHNITSGSRNILLLGLISEVNILDMEGQNPTSWMGGGGSGNMLHLSHYLLLNGVIDLNGQSQLLQPMGSIVDANSSGHLDRDQQGTASSYNYNYWSSPVGPGASNAAYSVSNVLLDGSNPAAPGPIDFGAAYSYADAAYTGNKKISTYWLHKFHGTANNYFEWNHIGELGTMKAGEGFSMKGTTGAAAIEDTQNYTFRGLPNNGNISPSSTGPEENYLIGNPYPSAIDADKFIADNLVIAGANNVFNGTIYFWSHFANKTHYLQEYVGGYAAYNLAGGVRAVAIDERINPTTGTGGQMPQQFIPVGQAFFINTMLDPSLDGEMEDEGLPNVSGGPVIFKNSQRAFILENPDDGGSVFHSQERKDPTLGINTNGSSQEVEQHKIWLKFKSPKGYHRQILVTADQRATDNFDLGFDAPLIENNVEDMYWYFSNYQFVIQGVKDFNLDRVLDLGVKVKEPGTLSIGIDDLKNIPDEMNIYLADSLMQVVHDLRVEPYVTESEAGTFTDRFKLVFQDKTQIEQPEDPIVIEEGPFEVLYVTGTRNVLLRNPELHKVERVYLNNMLGQQVHVYYDVPLEREVELPVKRFSAGVYIVKVHYEGGILTRKVILE